MADMERPAQAVSDLVHRIEDNEGLERPASVLARVATTVARDGPVNDALTGRWLGHAVHPMLTDLPIGFWTSTTVLDFLGGKRSRRAADRLLALGIVCAVPTAATGLAEWLHLEERDGRVGVVHANANLVGLVCYSASWVARKRGRRGRGVVYALAGMTFATLGGVLGGHLAIARNVGSTWDAGGEDTPARAAGDAGQADADEVAGDWPVSPPASSPAR